MNKTRSFTFEGILKSKITMLSPLSISFAYEIKSSSKYCSLTGTISNLQRPFLYIIGGKKSTKFKNWSFSPKYLPVLKKMFPNAKVIIQK